MHVWTACENGVYILCSRPIYSFSFGCERESVSVLKDLDRKRGTRWNAHRGDRMSIRRNRITAEAVERELLHGRVLLPDVRV